MAIIDDVTTDDGWLTMESITTKSRPTDADISAARFVDGASRVDVTVVYFITSGFLFFLYDYTIVKLSH